MTASITPGAATPIPGQLTPTPIPGQLTPTPIPGQLTPTPPPTPQQLAMGQQPINANVSMKSLLEAGVHFGHQTKRWNPKMRPYIFTERNGIHIIDLQQTVKGMQDAYKYVVDLVAGGGKVLFVGTKKQAQDAVKEEAERCGMFFVNQRWLGGMLTNFTTIKTRLKHMTDLETRKARGEFERLPKKEATALDEEIIHLNLILGGIRNLRDMPDAIYVVDTHKERIVMAEALRLEIPVVAIADTNSDPDEIAYPIPGNDDAIRAVRIITAKLADACLEGQARRESQMADNAAGRDRHNKETETDEQYAEANA